MTDEDVQAPRLGSYSDLARRMDRMEQNHERLSRELLSLTGTVTRVELNQVHAEELSKVRFGALDNSTSVIDAKIDSFIKRIESLITGEVQLPQGKLYEQRLRDYELWHNDVEDRLDGHDKFETQSRLLGRLAVLMLTTNVIAIVAAGVAFVRAG